MPVDLSLCNIDYAIEDDDPVVYLFTRDPDGRQVIIADRSFEPYFYVESRALFDPRIKKIIGVVGKELSPRVRRIEFGFRGLTRLGVSELAKVVCKTPTDVGEIRRKLHNLKPPIETFEADILFVLRYLIDRGIKCGVRYDPERDVILGPAEPDSNYRVLFIDIEVFAKSQYDLHKYRAPVTVIGFYDSYTGEYHVHYTSKYPVRGLSSHFRYYPNETALLQSIIDYLSNRNTRPDFILSFTTFDMVYLLRRMMLKGMDYRAISPIRKVKLDVKRHQILIGGMEYLDIGEIYRTLYRRHAKYYSLEEICRVALGPRYRKLPLKYGDVYNTWLYDKKNVLLYNLRDVYLIKKLTYTTGLLESLDVIRRKIGVRMSDALIPSRIADIAHLRLLYGKVVLPTRPIEKVEHLDQLKYKGAEVFECKAGIYENVLGIDWEAIYTNVIKSFNIGYNTLDPFGKLRIDDNHRFKSPEEEESWTVQIIREIEPLLVENKRLIKEAQKAGDERLVNLLKAKRLGLKAILHGQYGYFGFKGNPVKGYPASRLLCITIAEAIAMVPRIIQEEGVKRAAKELGYDLIYGDTDSIYVKLPPGVSPETVRDQFQEKLSKFIRERWNIDPRHFKLDIDVLFKRVVFLAKKRYAGIDSNGMIINKGLELVRRDQSILTSNTQEGLIKHIFSGSSRDEIKRFVAMQVNRIYSAPLMEIAVPANLRHRYDEYKTSSQHLKAFVFSREYLNLPLVEGERFYYVLIKPINIKCKIKIGDKVRTFIPDAVAFTHPDQIIGDLEVKVESSLLSYFNADAKTKIRVQIDYERMIEKTIKGKVMPFLELLHISWDEVLDEARRLRSNK